MPIELATLEPDLEQREAYHRKLYDEFLHSEHYDTLSNSIEDDFSRFLTDKLYDMEKK